MGALLGRRLSALADEIAAARSELDMLRDRQAAARAGLEDACLRMLVAETPLADRDLHAAAEAVRRVDELARRAEARLAALLDDRRSLDAARS